MEKQIQKAAEFISGGKNVPSDDELSVLTKCSVEIARTALIAFKDELRVKALNIASAIADFEDEWKEVQHGSPA